MTDKKQDLPPLCRGCEGQIKYTVCSWAKEHGCPKPAPKEPSEQDKRELEYVLGSKEPDKTPITISGRTWFSEQYVRFLEAEIDALTQKYEDLVNSSKEEFSRSSAAYVHIRDLEQKVQDLEASVEKEMDLNSQHFENIVGFKAHIKDLEAELKKKDGQLERVYACCKGERCWGSEPCTKDAPKTPGVVLMEDFPQGYNINAKGEIEEPKKGGNRL